MSLEGRLEDLSLGDIFQIISLSKRSGVLTIIRKEGTGRLVFNKGQLIYGSSDSVSRLGYTLIKKGLITTEELEKGLRLQKANEMKTPLGGVLEKMGAISKDILQSELQNHLVEVVRDLVNWESGSFHFELRTPTANDAVLEEGLNMEFLLMEATRRQDEIRREQSQTHSAPEASPETSFSSISNETSQSSSRGAAYSNPGPMETTLRPQPNPGAQEKPSASRKDLILLTSMIEELSGPSSSSEITLLVLRFASEVMNRAVVFLVRREDILGLGQFGLLLKDESADEKIRGVQIPLTDPSIFKEVIHKKTTYKGPLAREKWHQYFIEQIGGGWPREVFISPLMSGQQVIALLYGDNLPMQASIQETEGLEAFVKVAGFVFGKAMLERKLQEARQKELG